MQYVIAFLNLILRDIFQLFTGHLYTYSTTFYPSGGLAAFWALGKITPRAPPMFDTKYIP